MSLTEFLIAGGLGVAGFIVALLVILFLAATDRGF